MEKSHSFKNLSLMVRLINGCILALIDLESPVAADLLVQLPDSSSFSQYFRLEPEVERIFDVEEHFFQV